MIRISCLVASALAVLVNAPWGQPGRWVEHFGTTAGIDTVATTALVDTEASRLTLHRFRMTPSGQAPTSGEAFAVALWGVYFCRYTAGRFTQSRKMLMLE